MFSERIETSDFDNSYRSQKWHKIKFFFAYLSDKFWNLWQKSKMAHEAPFFSFSNYWAPLGPQLCGSWRILALKSVFQTPYSISVIYHMCVLTSFECREYLLNLRWIQIPTTSRKQKSLLDTVSYYVKGKLITFFCNITDGK